MAKRTGFIRLGIVLSILWIILCLSIAAYEYWWALQSGDRFFVYYRPEDKPGLWGIIWDEPVLKIDTLLTAALAPILLAWTTIPIAVRAVRWVAAGFRSKHQP